MSSLVRVLFLVAFAAALGGKVLISAIPFADDEALDVLPNPAEEYEDGSEDDYQFPSRQWKRGGNYGFWSPHPSDYSPMRRPGSLGQGPRSSKRSDTDTPYHPIPRSIQTRQSKQNGVDDLESFLDGLRGKRQSPGSFLLMKLGRMNKAADRKLGRRATLPYALTSGSVNVKQQQG